MNSQAKEQGERIQNLESRFLETEAEARKSGTAHEFEVESSGKRQRVLVSPGEEGRDLAALLAKAGFPLNTRCGGRGGCRGCEVELTEGTALGPDGVLTAPTTLRSCLTKLPVSGQLSLRIPQRAHLALAPQVGETFEIDAPYEVAPPFEVIPGVADTAFAIDIGTTTVVVMLVDLTHGEILARAGAFNAQIRYGDNVLTRIGAASTGGHLEGMRHAILYETLMPLLARAATRAGRAISRICGGAIAGNTTMLHLLLGVDPSPLGVAPFEARFLETCWLDTAAVGLCEESSQEGLKAEVPVVLLPGFSGYVGADIMAGVYSTGMLFDEAPSLLVDIGTNGEMVLRVGERLLGCATAAGPAFEGAGLLSGTRAHEGAISKITIHGPPYRFEFETIGGGAAEKSPGLCGTGYVDFLAEGRRSGLLLGSGRFNRKALAELPEGSLLDTPHGMAIRLAGELGVGEQDVASLLQAKAAIAAGMEILLSRAGIQASDIGRLYLAGGFGMHIDLDKALAIGFFPGFRREQIRVVGNSSLGGALLAAVDKKALPDMEALRARMEIVELNAHAEFEDKFIDALSLP